MRKIWQCGLVGAALAARNKTTVDSLLNDEVARAVAALLKTAPAK